MSPTGSESRSTLMPARQLMERYSCPRRPSMDRRCECPIVAPEPLGTAVLFPSIQLTLQVADTRR